MSNLVEGSVLSEVSDHMKSTLLGDLVRQVKRAIHGGEAVPTGLQRVSHLGLFEGFDHRTLGDFQVLTDVVNLGGEFFLDRSSARFAEAFDLVNAVKQSCCLKSGSSDRVDSGNESDGHLELAQRAESRNCFNRRDLEAIGLRDETTEQRYRCLFVRSELDLHGIRSEFSPQSVSRGQQVQQRMGAEADEGKVEERRGERDASHPENEGGHQTGKEDHGPELADMLQLMLQDAFILLVFREDPHERATCLPSEIRPQVVDEEDDRRRVQIDLHGSLSVLDDH